MKDCYVGDIGDYGKIAFLRELRRQGLSIGVNWYKTDVIMSDKQNDGNFCIPNSLADYDIDLSLRLRRIFHSQDGIVRSIEALENERFIDGAPRTSLLITATNGMSRRCMNCPMRNLSFLTRILG
ncbi:MAG: hypothetical protein IJJ23_07150 [Clostridia bacterium]|nr:hypothetical protein [Clostridia bacterium]